MNERHSHANSLARARRALCIPLLCGVLVVAVGDVPVIGASPGGASQAAPRSFDERVLLNFRDSDDLARPVGPDWLPNVVRDCTSLGSWIVLSTVTISFTVYFVLTRRYAYGAMLLTAVGSGLFIGKLIKNWVERPRPQLVPHGDVVSGESFPSNHALMSTIVYLLLAVLLQRDLPARRVRVLVFLVAALVPLVVGMTRVYLGVHWPTDVVAGWTIGLVWVGLFSVLARVAHRPVGGNAADALTQSADR